MDTLWDISIGSEQMQIRTRYYRITDRSFFFAIKIPEYLMLNSKIYFTKMYKIDF